MTTEELQEEFERAAAVRDVLKKIKPNTITTQYFLNEGQDTFIQKRLSNIKESIKDTQKNLDEIRPLLKLGTELNKDVPASVVDKFNVYTLPDDYLYLINDRTLVNYCNADKEVDNRLVSSERIGQILNGTHTQSHPDSPVSEMYMNKIKVHLNSNLGFTIQKVIIDYVKKYRKINLFNGDTSELDESVHRDIIQLGINIFLEAVESGRFRTNLEKNITTTEQIQ